MNSTLFSTLASTLAPTSEPEIIRANEVGLIILLSVCVYPLCIITFGCHSVYRRRLKREQRIKPKIEIVPIIKKGNKNDMIKSDCSICIQKINFNSFLGDNFLNLECTHTFHKKCLQDWISSEMEKGVNPLCPLCRTEIMKPNVENVYYSFK